MNDDASTPLRPPVCTCGDPICQAINQTADALLVVLHNSLPNLHVQLLAALHTTARLCVAADHDVDQICSILIEQVQLLQYRLTIAKGGDGELTAPISSIYPKGNA